LATCRRTDSGKYWRRRLRPLTRYALVGLALAAGQHASAQAPRDDSSNDFATLEAFLDGVQSLTADFEQELWTADRKLLQTDAGKLALKRPDRFRWTYVEPTELIVVADGKELSIYDVELAQVTVSPFENVGASPAMLLSGDRTIREQFEVVATYEADGLDWVKLEPLAVGSDFTSVLIGFRGTLPQRLELVDGLNQVTRIVLDNLDVNPELADDVFELEVPDGVDVLGEG
jgi:outer membrane lipoprotein carrier protein